MGGEGGGGEFISPYSSSLKIIISLPPRHAIKWIKRNDERRKKFCTTKSTEKKFPREIFNYLQFIRVHFSSVFTRQSLNNGQKRRESFFSSFWWITQITLVVSMVPRRAEKRWAVTYGMRRYLFGICSASLSVQSYLFDLMNCTLICAVHGVTESTAELKATVKLYSEWNAVQSGDEKLCHLSASSEIDGRAIIIRVLSGHINVDTFPVSHLQLITVAPERIFNNFTSSKD